MRQIPLRMPEDLVGLIDELRGNVFREPFMRAMLRRQAENLRDDQLFDPRAYVAQSEDPEFARKRRKAVDYLDRHRGGKDRLSFLFELVSGLADEEAGPSLVIETDAEFRVTCWKGDGYTPEEAAGRYLSELLPTLGGYEEERRIARGQVLIDGYWSGTTGLLLHGEPLVAPAETRCFRDGNGEVTGYRICIWAAK